jgi:xyloglucan:xyloglucosyl transferase
MLCSFYVDSVPIRVLKYTPNSRRFYPKVRPQWVFTSIWNGDDWATRGGQDKIDWRKAPFVTHVKDFKLNGCVYDGKGALPDCASPLYTGSWWSTHDDLNPVEERKLEWVRSKYLGYNYCVDTDRYGATLLQKYPECKDQTQP